MNFSSSIIEEWLLTGKAVVKNLSCGNAGLVQIPVPEGKTYIITQIEILPFANVKDNTNSLAVNETFTEVALQDLAGINTRNQYQLLFYNERVNNSWNIRNDFSLLTYADNTGKTNTAPANNYKKHIIDCFMVVESNSFLFLKYVDFLTAVPTLTQAQLNTVFNINWPPSPNFGYNDQFDIINYDQGTGPAYNYVPQGLETSFSTPSENFNSQFVIPAQNGNIPNYSTFIPPLVQVPGEVAGPLTVEDINSIPVYNIQYIEINRRLSTTGLL